MTLTYFFLAHTHVQWISQGDGFTIMSPAHTQTLRNLQHFIEVLHFIFQYFIHSPGVTQHLIIITVERPFHGIVL